MPAVAVSTVKDGNFMYRTLKILLSAPVMVLIVKRHLNQFLFNNSNNLWIIRILRGVGRRPYNRYTIMCSESKLGMM